jgi:hypothetical protein
MSLSASQSVLDQDYIMFGKRQRSCQHSGQVLTFPCSCHHTGFRMLVDSLKNVSDFVREDVAKESRPQGLVYQLEAIGIDFDPCPLKDECMRECFRVEGTRVAVSELDLNRVLGATAIAKPFELDSDPRLLGPVPTLQRGSSPRHKPRPDPGREYREPEHREPLAPSRAQSAQKSALSSCLPPIGEVKRQEA